MNFVWLIVYAGLLLMVAGLVLAIKPIHRLRVRRRAQGLKIVAVGGALALVGFILPAPESRLTRVESRLDEFMPRWQFSESHTMKVAAPPATVYDAVKKVRASEIRLFRALTWIRRGGRDMSEGILNAGDDKPLIEVAKRGGFAILADDSASELVMGTVVVAPLHAFDTLRATVFRANLPPGFAIAAINFRVLPDANGSLVTTETRVFASSPATKRQFARYWRLIYPGSALIRRMWLRAIARRATQKPTAPRP